MTPQCNLIGAHENSRTGSPHVTRNFDQNLGLLCTRESVCVAMVESHPPVYGHLQYAKTEQAIKNWMVGRPGSKARLIWHH